MTYILTITRNEPNPLYQATQQGGYRYSEEPAVFTTTVLTMEVTPEQFDRIRMAALQEAK